MTFRIFYRDAGEYGEPFGLATYVFLAPVVLTPEKQMAVKAEVGAQVTDSDGNRWERIA